MFKLSRNYISSFPGKVNLWAWERKPIIEPWAQDEHCGFHLKALFQLLEQHVYDFAAVYLKNEHAVKKWETLLLWPLLPESFYLLNKKYVISSAILKLDFLFSLDIKPSNQDNRLPWCPYYSIFGFFFFNRIDIGVYLLTASPKSKVSTKNETKVPEYRYIWTYSKLNNLLIWIVFIMFAWTIHFYQTEWN